MKPFKTWIHELWIDNCDELYALRAEKYTEQEYFQKYKWWLRREYQHQKQKEQIDNEYI